MGAQEAHGKAEGWCGMRRLMRREERVDPRTWWRARARVALVGGMLGVAAASLMALPLGIFPGTNVAFASGLGLGPTMLANNTPALLYPKPPAGKPAPPSNGIFAPEYAVGTAITFTEDLSRAPSAPDPTTVTWHWVFGDGTTADGTFTPTHTYTKPGTYVVHAQIPDPKTKFADVDTAQIHVVAALPANPPVARATSSASFIVGNNEATFDGSASTSADGSALTYLWNFGDGTTATTARAQHTFTQWGMGIVSLTVTDAHGATNVTTLNVIVPKSQLTTSTANIAPGASTSFTTAEATSSDTATPGGSVGQQANYTWSFGDDSQDVTSSQPSVSHTFAKPGHYLVTMQELDGPTTNQTPGPFEALAVTVAVPPPPPPPPWRYAAGGAAIALGVLISLAAAVRAQRREVALAEQRKRGGRSRSYGRGSRDDDAYDDYYDDAPRARGRGRTEESRSDRRRGGSRGGSSARQRRPRDDRW